MNTLLDYKQSTDLAPLVAADLGQEPKQSGKMIIIHIITPFLVSRSSWAMSRIVTGILETFLKANKKT